MIPAMELPTHVQVVERVRLGDLPGALGLTAASPAAQLKERAATTRKSFEESLTTAVGSDKKVLHQAVGCLNLAERILGDLGLRAAWDAAWAHKAGLPKDVDAGVMAAVHLDWQYVFPEVTREATRLFGEALRNAAAGELKMAVETAQRALGLNPFHVAFRGVVQSWRQTLGSQPKAKLPSVLH